MTDRQRKFADEYIISCNATQAAISAGYSEKYAHTNANKLLQNTTVKQYIDEQLNKISNKKVADASEVMEYLTSVMRGEHTEEVVVVEGFGGAKRVDKEVGAKDRLKAAELLGKRYGIFTDKVNLEIEPVTIVNDLKE